MPARSLAQLRLMFAKEKRGEVAPGTAKEWAHSTKNISKLPEHVKHAHGGEIMRHYSAGGERYGMSMGGLTHKMADGGEVDPYAAELLKRAIARRKGMAHGGFFDNNMHEDENEYDHGISHERYEPETAEHYAHGGMAECPACGHRFAHGGMAEEDSMVDDNEHSYASGNVREDDRLHQHVDDEAEHRHRFASALRARHGK